MNTKEQRIGEIMKSLDGMQRAQGDQHLFEKVTARLDHSEPTAPTLTPQLLLKIAAGLALLISLNVISLHYYTRATQAETPANPVSTEYFSYFKNITPVL